MSEEASQDEQPRPVMGIAEAAKLLNTSVDSVRRWIDANEPDDEHPERVPVAERTRGEGGPVSGSWRRPYRDAVEAEAQRRRGCRPGGEAASTGPPV